jgi:ribosomal protein S25
MTAEKIEAVHAYLGEKYANEVAPEWISVRSVAVGVGIKEEEAREILQDLYDEGWIQRRAHLYRY